MKGAFLGSKIRFMINYPLIVLDGKHDKTLRSPDYLLFVPPCGLTVCHFHEVVMQLPELPEIGFSSADGPRSIIPF